jgi:hypothetical protein
MDPAESINANSTTISPGGIQPNGWVSAESARFLLAVSWKKWGVSLTFCQGMKQSKFILSTAYKAAMCEGLQNEIWTPRSAWME